MSGWQFGDKKKALWSLIIGCSLLILGATSVFPNSEEEKENETTYVGSALTLSHNIQGNFNALGDTILVSSPIQGDCDIIAHKIILNAKVEGDAELFASRIIIAQNARVEGQTSIAGQRVSLEGALSGDASIKADRVYVNADVGGELIIKSNVIEIGKNARLSHGFSYPKGASVIISKNAQIFGETHTFEEVESSVFKEFENIFENPTLSKLIVFLGLFLQKGFEQYLSLGATLWTFSGLLCLWVVAFGCVLLFCRATPLILQEMTQNSFKNPGRSLGIGFLGVIGLPFFAFMMCVTIVGIPFAFLLILFYGALLFLGKIMGIWLVGQTLLRLTPLKEKKSLGWGVLMFLVSFPLVSFLSFIPLVGWLFAVLVFLIGVGSILGRVFFLPYRIKRDHVLYLKS